METMEYKKNRKIRKKEKLDKQLEENNEGKVKEGEKRMSGRRGNKGTHGN